MNYEVLQPPPETSIAEESCFDAQQTHAPNGMLALPAPPNNELEFLQRCDKFKAVYSELLYRWQLLVKVNGDYSIWDVRWVVQPEIFDSTVYLANYPFSFPKQRCELLKSTSQTPTPHRGLQWTPVCPTCDSSTSAPSSYSTALKDRSSLSCTKCKKAKLTCAICRLAVKGDATTEMGGGMVSKSGKNNLRVVHLSGSLSYIRSFRSFHVLSIVRPRRTQ